MAGAARRIGPADLLGTLLIAGATYGVYSEYQKSVQASSAVNKLKAQQQLGAGGAGLQQQPASQVVVKESAHEFLAKLADKGDSTAAKTVDVVGSKQAPASVQILPPPKVDLDEPFRFDVSGLGLAGALQSILETKRTYEKNLINDARRTGRYPSDFAQQCRQLRQEKEELKRMIDGLTGTRKSSSWWWPF